MTFKGKMNVPAMGDASTQSENSGAELVKLVEELIDGVEDLEQTFSGNGAVKFRSFMAESNRVQNALIGALASISRGQADIAKEYITMDDAFEAGGSAAESVASATEVTGFSFGGR
ncbi:WXG100 family type VII secretion target [Zafaria sp. Z1313]|uniref:WXG100 family type VII secretion target n=1 Tax=unclassified Zafaria TaxID=2828765 RepID=UPI002E78DB7F|nr:WXG100 family type VII secretion target [Zafaria sp. J156]MEE1621235.1 WXG100 family type VII secretion target [Zafaria sp. J156]